MNWKERWDKNYSEFKTYKEFGLYNINSHNLHHPLFEDYLFKKWRYPTKTDDVFEIGCGPGNLLGYFVGKVNSISGSDISSIAIKRAKERYSKYENCNFYEVVNEFPNDNKYDLIFSITVFQHIPREYTQNYINESYKHLKDGGMFFFNMLSGDVHNKFEAELKEDGELCQPAVGYSKEDIIDRCKQAGFDNIEIDKMLVGAKDDYFWWYLVRCKK